MSINISSLIRGIDKLEEVALTVDGLHDKDFGVELIAFTHDEAYWSRLVKLLDKLTCPLSFHGPYVKIEATSAPGTPESDWLLESYRRVFDLARDHGVGHIVFHYSQLHFTPDTVEAARKNSLEHLRRLLDLAGERGVHLLVENLPIDRTKPVPLFTNEGYFDLFRSWPGLESIIDIGHAHMNGLDVPAFLKEFPGTVKAYHFHNNNGLADQHNHIFDGTFDFEAFAPVYHELSPSPAIVMEYEPHVTLSWDELFQQAGWLRDRYL